MHERETLTGLFFLHHIAGHLKSNIQNPLSHIDSPHFYKSKIAHLKSKIQNLLSHIKSPPGSQSKVRKVFKFTVLNTIQSIS